mmetsp:Transcript_39859/g.91888  ORF Transcript_39859/g.91888 Transcript_39859/m.91888 type:complete len:259 (+) Transcript_39859:347-1123(+)
MTRKVLNAISRVLNSPVTACSAMACSTAGSLESAICSQASSALRRTPASLSLNLAATRAFAAASPGSAIWTTAVSASPLKPASASCDSNIDVANCTTSGSPRCAKTPSECNARLRKLVDGLYSMANFRSSMISKALAKLTASSALNASIWMSSTCTTSSKLRITSTSPREDFSASNFTAARAPPRLLGATVAFCSSSTQRAARTARAWPRSQCIHNTSRASSAEVARASTTAACKATCTMPWQTACGSPSTRVAAKAA